VGKSGPVAETGKSETLWMGLEETLVMGLDTVDLLTVHG